MQQHLKFGTYTAPEPDKDGGYTLALATTSSSNSGRSLKGNMKNVPLFTVEAYDLKWTYLSAAAFAQILQQVVGKAEFDFYHYNIYRARWETGKFYAANYNSPIISLVEGEEYVDELSFQVTGVNPL